MYSLLLKTSSLLNQPVQYASGPDHEMINILCMVLFRISYLDKFTDEYGQLLCKLFSHLTITDVHLFKAVFDNLMLQA